MDIKQYNGIIRPHQRLLRQLLLDLEFHIEDIGEINLFAIEHRMKTFKSALRKSQRKNIPIEELTDLAGLRVVVGTKSETEQIARFLSRMQVSDDISIVSDEIIARDDGYFARHIVVKADGRYLRSVYDARVEVQLRAALQHAFDSISRAWSYNSNRPYSDEWKKEFLQVAEHLRIVDERVSSLQDEVVKLSVDLGDADSLSPLSLQKIVHDRFGESIKLDDAVDECRYLVDVGIDTVGKLKTFFQDQHITDIRKELESAAQGGNQSAASLLGFTLHSFWTTVGTRLEATREIILRNSQK